MKYLSLLVKNLLRNRRRTFLTVSSIAVSLFLVATLMTILTELNNPPETPDSALRLVTRHRISLFNALPAAHRESIARVPGVEAVVGLLWFGGIYKDPSNFFANFSADVDDFFRVYPDKILSQEARVDFIQDRTGAIAGDSLAARFGWSVGDRIFLESSTWPVSVELTLRGIYEGGPDLGGGFYFHWDYFNEVMKDHFGGWDNTGTFAVRVSSAEVVPRVAEDIDTLFRNSAFPTKTETEKAFLLSFAAMLGDVQLFIASIVSVIVFTILLVAANTMAMSIRERAREIGILKALGFRSRHILGLLIGESVVLALGGALLGSWGARLLFPSLNLASLTSGFIQRFEVTSGTLLFCALIGVFVGVVSAGVPALRAARRPVVEAIRNLA
jgi:putative ABC transport system permease protein